MANEPSSWHLNKGIPITLILAVLVQAAWVAWWAASVTKDITKLQQEQILNDQINVEVIEARQRWVQVHNSLNRIEKRLDRISERLPEVAP